MTLIGTGGGGIAAAGSSKSKGRTAGSGSASADGCRETGTEPAEEEREDVRLAPRNNRIRDHLTKRECDFGNGTRKFDFGDGWFGGSWGIDDSGKAETHFGERFPFRPNRHFAKLEEAEANL